MPDNSAVTTEQDHLSSCTSPESLSPEDTEDDLGSRDALADLCLQWAHLLKPTESSMISQKVSTIHETMSVMSKRLDELRISSETTRSETRKSIDEHIPVLVDQTRELKELFRRIDHFEKFIERAERSLRQCEKRMDDVSTAYDTNSVRNRVTSFFKPSKREPLKWKPMNLVSYDDFFREPPK
eukprot:438265_1